MKSESASSRQALCQLRPYQREVALAVLDSVFGRKGLTFTVEIARQGGKNELSAQLELLLLALYMAEPKNLVKCSPTFKPQTVISMMRLRDRLNEAGFDGIWSAELGYIIRLGNARAVFLSAEESANVVGNTAHLLLEIDEAQDVSKDKYTKEFKPMGATGNVTTVHYGTTWDETTLLEEVKAVNLELERKDGIRRHFRYDWEEVAKYNPDYLAYVEGERERLGENHPLFLTQYRLLPVHEGGSLFTSQQRAQMRGEHGRCRHGERDKVYVAGIDIAGEAKGFEGVMLPGASPNRDSTVVTIGELDYAGCNDFIIQPVVRVVEHYRWTGEKHNRLYTQLLDIIKNLWHCRRVVIDATGMGEPISSFLRQALGSKVLPFKFTQQSKSELGFNLLAVVNSGRLKVYKNDGSPESVEFWLEMEKAKSRYRPNQTMNFYVDLSQGHDDFLMSLALTVEAASDFIPRGARGR